MCQRILQVLIPLCLLAILACGSPRIYPSDQQTRDRRHDCATCRRERPEALATWYAPPTRREYISGEPEIARWPINRSFQPDPLYPTAPLNIYGAAPRSRGSPVVINGQRDIVNTPGTYIREDPINFQQRDLGFDVAAAPAAPVRAFGAPSALFQPAPPVIRGARLGRTPYQSSSFYDVIKRESVPKANNRYSGFVPSGDEASIEDMHESLKPYEDPKKVSAVYRADKYADDTLDQGNPNAPAEKYFRRQVPEHYSMRQAPAQYSRRQAPGQYFRRQAEEVQQPRREEYLDSQVVHVPEIKRDPHRRASEHNIMKIMQNVGKEETTVTNDSAWQDQKGQELEGSPRNAARTEGQKQTGDVNVLNDGDQPDAEEDRSQKLGDAVEGYGNVERSKKSTMLTPSTEISNRELANMWKTAEPILEISTEVLTLP